MGALNSKGTVLYLGMHKKDVRNRSASAQAAIRLQVV